MLIIQLVKGLILEQLIINRWLLNWIHLYLGQNAQSSRYTFLITFNSTI